VAAIFDPFEIRAYCPLLSTSRGGCVNNRCRTNWYHGNGSRQTCWSPLCRVTDVNDFRLDLARQMEQRSRWNVEPRAHAEGSESQLGMKEGSLSAGNVGRPQPPCARYRAYVSWWKRLRCWVYLRNPCPFDWTKVVFNMLTIKGIYGREMYETLVQDDGDARNRVEHLSPAITHRSTY